MKRPNCYITTPIYYPTARPHVGSLYSTLLADVIARWQRLCGKEVFFLTGTDEHGQKIAQAAGAVGKSPQEFVDGFVDAYKELWKKFNIDYTHFIRTTDGYHVEAVERWLAMLIDKGDIYKAYYQGWYCISCETFVAHDDTAQEQYNAGKKGPLCESCQRDTTVLSEESYFFRLSAYQDRLLAWYKEHPHFVLPQERINEVLRFVEGGLKDLSISRTTLSWGIPFPGDTKHVTYVWADALLNYLTGIGYLQTGKEDEFARWWPADVQVMGKDIVRFHAVYWPAFLMASGLPLPHHLLVHGWIKVDKEKMSKSRGNVIDPELLWTQYGTDVVRYYLIREMSIGQDTDFSFEHLEQRNNADLANDLGNLLNRITTLAHKYEVFHVDAPELFLQPSKELIDEVQVMTAQFAHYMKHYSLHMAYAEVWKYINKINAYFHAQEPWKLAKDRPHEFKEVLGTACHALYAVAIYCWPLMPESMEKLMYSLGVVLPERHQRITEEFFSRPRQSFKINVIPPLFKKIEQEKNMSSASDLATEKITINEPAVIDITDFAKVELLVGTITACEVVPNSSKLYKLQVDFGPRGFRQVISGVQALFKPDELVSKQAIFVVNLKPRMMMGLESHGMLLIAGTALSTVGALVPNGTPLR